MNIHTSNVIITPEGRVGPVPDPADGEKHSLEELQAMVGGPIEIINCPLRPPATRHRIMVVHEEGKRKELPPNGLATYLAGPYIFRDDHIVGTVVYCDSDLAK